MENAQRIFVQIIGLLMRFFERQNEKKRNLQQLKQKGVSLSLQKYVETIKSLPGI